MEIQYKEAQVSGVTVEDEEKGIVSALVSVTGIKDRVGDIIEPGCYDRTLKERKPKGVWHHSWTDPVSKTLEAEELMPGDKRLPKTLPDGSPWPREAGALLIKTQFNLDGERGKQAFSDVKFFGSEQEWSIGYNVPEGGSRTEVKSGSKTRYLLASPGIDLFEYSPVLFGAMPVARTYEGVKSAQIAYKSAMGMSMDDIEARLAVLTKALDDGDGETETDMIDDTEDIDDIEPPDPDADEDEEDDEEDEEVTKAIRPATLRKVIGSLTELLDEVVAIHGDDDDDEDPDEKGFQTYVEIKAAGYELLTEAVDDLRIPSDIADALEKTAQRFDESITHGPESYEKAAADVMDVMEKTETENFDEQDSLAVIARVMGDLLDKKTGQVQEVGESKADSFIRFGVEYKMVKHGTRVNGWPRRLDGVRDTRRMQVAAMVAGLGTYELTGLRKYLENVPGDRALKRLVQSEVENRRTQTKKDRTPAQMAACGEKGHAFKNHSGEWSYPIETKDDLKNAIQAFGRAADEDKDRLKTYIVKRATDLGAEDMIPDGWQSKGVVIDLSDLSDLQATLDAHSK